MIYLKIIISILGALFAVYSLFLEIKKSSKTGYSYKNIGLLVAMGILFVGSGVVTKGDGDDMKKLTNNIDSIKVSVQTYGLIVNNQNKAEPGANFYTIMNSFIENHYTTNQTFIAHDSSKSGMDNKLNDAFSKLESEDQFQKEVAINYIIDNSTAPLTEEEILKIIKVVKNWPRPEMEGKTMVDRIRNFLRIQRKSPNIEKYFKQVVAGDYTQEIGWKYLLRQDVVVDTKYAISIIKANPPYYWTSYADIVTYAMDNKPICLALLNSRDMVDFIVQNCPYKVNLNTSYQLIKNKIETNKKYEDYKSTYFFTKVKEYNE